MIKCLKITLLGNFPDGFLRDTIQTNARKLSLEGIAQVMPEGMVRVLICGSKDDVDNFIDALHKSSIKTGLENIEIEPFVKDRDFRGVFRVIE